MAPVIQIKVASSKASRGMNDSAWHITSQGLTVQPRMAWNCLYRSGRSIRPRNPPARSKASSSCSTPRPVLFFQRFVYFMCVGVMSTCKFAYQKKELDPMGLIIDGCGPPCWCWESRISEEWPVLLTTEPSFQSKRTETEDSHHVKH